MVSHEENRIKRLKVVQQLMKTKTMKEKIIGQCCFVWGCSRRAMLEYIKVVENAK